MPIAPAVIAALIGAAATATEVGVQLSGAGQPSQPKPQAAPPSGPTAQQVSAAVAPQALSIESATGGSVSPDYLSQIAPVLAGVGGQPNTNKGVQQVLQQILGNQPSGIGTGTAAAGVPKPFSPSGIPVNLAPIANTGGTSDFLSKIVGAL